MPKSVRSRDNGSGSLLLPLSSNPAGHINPINESLKQLINASIIYTKDIILTTVTTEYEIETTQENLDLLNEISTFPNIEDVIKQPDEIAPDILNENINYVSENINTPFLTLKSNEDVEWQIIGGVDKDKFDISKNNLLEFKQIPDYENPHSFSGTNIYTIQIKATDNAGNRSFKILTIVVQDADDTSPPPPPDLEPEPETVIPNNNDVVNNIINTSEIINTITITTGEIIDNVGEQQVPIYDNTFTENDLKELYNELVKGFLVKGPLHLPHANVVNGLYARLKKAIDDTGTGNINLFLYRDVIDILFKTKNIFIHNMSIEKQLKIIRKKYKENLCTVNELKEQIKALDPNGEKGLGFEGTLGIKMRKFKPAIYHQALFNLPLAWYIYLHDTTDIVPSLYYMTTQYIKQFNTKEQSYDKLLRLLDEKYLLEEDEVDTSSSSATSSNSSSSSSSSSSDGPCGSSSSSSDSEPDIQPDQKQDDCQCDDNQKYDECGNPIIETDDCGNPINESPCGDQTIDVSNGSNSTTSTTTTGGSAKGEGILGYFYDEKLNNAIFFISGSFTLTQTKKSKGKPKTERKKYYPKRKTRRNNFGAFGNPNNKQMVRNDDGTYSFFMDGHFEIVLKKRFRCVNKRKTKKHYNFCSLNQTFKNY